ncbi:MAG: sugar-binding protein [bacterium]
MLFFVVPITLQICLANDNVPELLCRKTYNPPMIDGILDDPGWREAYGVTDFILLAGEGLAKEQSFAYTLYDNQNLYVAFICMESRMDLINIETFLRDGFVWYDDCIEVFMDTEHNHTRYYHIISNLAEIRYDEIGMLRPWSWDGDWQVAIAKYKDRWTVEIAITFSSMNLKTPMPGEIWGFNLNREEWRLTEMSGWSPTRFDFHEPNNFGHLIFEPES